MPHERTFSSAKYRGREKNFFFAFNIFSFSFLTSIKCAHYLHPQLSCQQLSMHRLYLTFFISPNDATFNAKRLAGRMISKEKNFFLFLYFNMSFYACGISLNFYYYTQNKRKIIKGPRSFVLLSNWTAFKLIVVTFPRRHS